jgi:hypothetical protein
MTAQQPFHHFGRGPSRIALSGIVPVALVHDVDLVARRCRFSPVIGWSGRGVDGLAHGIRLRLRRGLGKGRRQGARIAETRLVTHPLRTEHLAHPSCRIHSETVDLPRWIRREFGGLFRDDVRWSSVIQDARRACREPWTSSSSGRPKHKRPEKRRFQEYRGFARGGRVDVESPPEHPANGALGST